MEDVRRRLLAVCRSHGQGNANVAELINRHILLLAISETTRQRYFELASTHVVPMIGHIQIRDLMPEVLEDCYAQLLRCREHCCDEPFSSRSREDEHLCRPLARSTVRKLHFLIGAAYQSATRWGWLIRNPIVGTRPPSSEPPRPQPSSQEQATRILAAALNDPDFGPMVWLAMASGARRGELCALRWRDFDPGRRQLVVERSIAHVGTVLREKDTKLHTRRHILLDHKTGAMLTTYHRHCRQRAAHVGTALSDDSFMFSANTDGLAPRRPDAVTGWYRRLVRKLGVATSWHKLRHFNATELISAGVDVRTVAGRLGHADGGTTLKYYSAWIKEADQRASAALARLLPLASQSNCHSDTSRAMTRGPGRPATYPLTIFFGNGDTVHGTVIVNSRIRSQSLSALDYKSLDWSDVDLKAETPRTAERNGKGISVHEKLQRAV